MDPKIDEQGEQILAALDEHGTLTTKSLRKQTDLDKNQLVIYRCDEHLRPAGLVEKQPTEGQSRAFALTEEGREYLNAHRDRIEQPDTLADVVDEVADLQEEIEDLRHRIQSAEGTVHTYDSRIDAVERELAEEIEGLKQWLEGEESRTNDLQKSVKFDIRQLDDDLQSVAEGYQESLDQTAENFKRSLGKTQIRLERLEADLEDVRDEVDMTRSGAETVQTNLHYLNDKIEETTEALDRGFLGRLWWLLTGR